MRPLQDTIKQQELDKMTYKCVCEPNLECSAKERCDELYRQMQENLRLGKHMIFLTSSKCAVNQADCIKLQRFREQMQQQKAR